MSKKFWITKDHYLRQEGQHTPKLVRASPGNPVLVTLGDDQGPSSDMKPFETKPEKPLPAHFVPNTQPVRKSHEHKSGKRAADE